MGKTNMKWIALALALAIGPASAQPFTPNAIPATTGTVALPTSTQSRTKLISGIAGKYTYIVGFHIVPASGAVVTWSFGTGTNCGTGTTIMDGPDTYGATLAPDNWGTGAGALMIAPQGTDVCLTIATGAIAGSVAFGQF